MKAAEKRRARHLPTLERVFRLFGVPGNRPGDSQTINDRLTAQKESNGENDSSEVHTKSFNGGCPGRSEACQGAI
jgi:hypothetical protein